MKKLKYLWIAKFEDGTLFKQNPEDKSMMEEGRNCYFDLLQLIKDGQSLRSFSLKSDDDLVTVDLKTGLFYVNGLALLLESDKLPSYPGKFNLIWYNQVSVDTKVDYDTKTKEILKASGVKNEYREYFIGWQCNINGKNYQQKIAVS